MNKKPSKKYANLLKAVLKQLQENNEYDKALIKAQELIEKWEREPKRLSNWVPGNFEEVSYYQGKIDTINNFITDLKQLDEED